MTGDFKLGKVGVKNDNVEPAGCFCSARVTSRLRDQG